MNAKQLIAAVTILAAAGSTFAAAPEQYVDNSKVQTTKTRAEVRAELEQAYRQGERFGSNEFVENVRVASTRSRDEIRAEAVQAAKANTARNNYIDG
jgi:hypothetical protein